MAERVFQWDREDIQACCNRLKRESKNLEKNRSLVENLREEVQEKWQSIASEIYLESLETDIENLGFIIEGVEELADLLGKVNTKAYGEMEKKAASWTRQTVAGLRQL